MPMEERCSAEHLLTFSLSLSCDTAGAGSGEGLCFATPQGRVRGRRALPGQGGSSLALAPLCLEWPSIAQNSAWSHTL